MADEKKNYQNSIETVLGDLCRLHHVLAHHVLEEFGLYRGQPALLHRLWEKDGRTHSELALSMNVSTATISRMIKRMERSGFVERRNDEDDERISRAFLTQKGKKIETEVKAVLADLDRKAFTGFSDKERREAGEIFDRIKMNLLKVREGGKL